MARSRKVTVSLYDSEDREVEIEARYTPSTSAYFDRSFGNWLPGDDDEVEILDVRAVDEDADVEEVRSRTDAIDEAVVLAAAED